jgi:hypothetical protein
MEVQGQIIVIGATETIGNKDFKKRVLVLETDEKYKQTIPVEFTQDKTSLLDNFAIGDTVKIGINLRGTEWQGRYFANIQGWNINKGEREKSAESFMPDRQGVNAMMENAEQEQAEDLNDLPF